MGPWFADHFKCNINHRIILQRNLSTYHGLGTPNSPGQTASTYQVRIPYNTESTNSIPMAPANEYRSPVPSNGLVQILCQFAPLSYKKKQWIRWIDFMKNIPQRDNTSSISGQKKNLLFKITFTRFFQMSQILTTKSKGNIGQQTLEIYINMGKYEKYYWI